MRTARRAPSLNPPQTPRWPTVLGVIALGCAELPDDQGGSTADKPQPLPLDSPTAVGDACATEPLQTATLTVLFPAEAGPCPFGEDDNAPAAQGVISGRIEQQAVLGLPDDAVVCDLDFIYGGVGAEVGVPMRYDDQFLFNFGGVVIASSDEGVIPGLPKEGVLPIYEWAAIEGEPLRFGPEVKGWCLGEAEGLSACEIPPSETGGLLRLDFSQSVINELSYRAIVEDRLDFGFVAVGDNDRTDCSHDAFSFSVSVPYFRKR